MPPICSYRREGGTWTSINERVGCGAPNVGARDGTVIEIDCGTGTIISIVKLPIPDPAPPGSTELTFNANNQWQDSSGNDWTPKIGLKAPQGSRLLVKEDNGEYIVLGYA